MRTHYIISRRRRIGGLLPRLMGGRLPRGVGGSARPA